MKTFNRYFFIAALIALCNVAFAQQNWTATSAKKWVKSRQWANGLKLKLSPSVNLLEFAKQYHANQKYWDEALSFLNDKKIDTLKPGKYLIDGDNVYAIITEGPTKSPEQAAWESHKKYIDLHYVIKGKEMIGVGAVAAASVIKPYDESKDIANYNAEGRFYAATPGEFFLFFPSDAHRPGIKTGGYESDKKLVIKILYKPE